MRAPVMALPASAALGALAFALVTGHGVPEDIAEALDGHAKAEALRAGLIAGAEAQVRSPESAVIVAGKAPLPPPPPPAIITLLREDGATAELIGANPGPYRIPRHPRGRQRRLYSLRHALRTRRCRCPLCA